MEQHFESLPEKNDQENLRQSIKIIESIHTGAEQRAQIILVVLGLKPSTELALYKSNSAPEEVELLLENTNLYFSKKDDNLDEKIIAEYAIAKDEATLQKLLAADSSEEYGLLMGYPETAVEAFVKSETYEGSLPEDIENSLFQLAFSKDHFEEEFEVVRKWNKAIAEYAPGLLAE